jgi:hypothetical protein
MECIPIGIYLHCGRACRRKAEGIRASICWRSNPEELINQLFSLFIRLKIVLYGAGVVKRGKPPPDLSENAKKKSSFLKLQQLCSSRNKMTGCGSWSGVEDEPAARRTGGQECKSGTDWKRFFLSGIRVV